ncbi:MAG: hypothetical protein IPO69_12385 [Saprospiraceae bacterium]|nr:hypothetical protein [Saprospiraceae bacterium]
MMTPVKFPYLPMAANFSTNPVTKGLEQVIFPFVSSVTVRDSSLRYISWSILLKSLILSRYQPCLIFKSSGLRPISPK